MSLQHQADPTELLVKLVEKMRMCEVLKQQALLPRIGAEFKFTLESKVTSSFPCGHSPDSEDINSHRETLLYVYLPTDVAAIKLSELMALPGGALMRHVFFT